MPYRLIIKFVIIMFLLSTALLEAAESMNQNILAESKIKKSSFKKVFSDIKKTLPKELRKCSIVVTDVKLVKIKNDDATEDWTVNICQESKVYCVQAYWLKGSYFESVKLKDEVLAWQKSIWETARKAGSEEEWRETLFYINEIEAMNQDGNNSNTDKNSQ